MSEQMKDTLIALIKGLSIETGNQYYSSKKIDEKGIETLISFIKNA